MDRRSSWESALPTPPPSWSAGRTLVTEVQKHLKVRGASRHADVETTMQRYTDLRLLDSQAAVERLPLPEGTQGTSPAA